MRKFIDEVADPFPQKERTGEPLERGLQTSADKLNDSYQTADLESDRHLEWSAIRYRNLFNLSPVPTWEENFERVAERLHDLRSSGITDLDRYIEANPDELARIVCLAEVTGVNPAVLALVGAEDQDSLVGPITANLVDDENASAWLAQLRTIWNGDGYLRLDHLEGHRLDGQVFHGILEWHALQTESEYDYSHVVVTIIDITDRIVAERNLENVVKSKDEFLASISHELRTPLTSVVGFAEVLQAMGDESPEDEKESLLKIIASEAADLSYIVEDLLVAARAELGQLTVAEVPVDVHAQIAQVIEGRDSLEQVRIPQRSSEKVVGIGDPQRVRQIIRNLLTNAQKYGGEEVTVKVVAAVEAVFIEVRDNGKGLADELHEAVFERYYTAGSDEGRPGSVGIGLTISRDLARLMRGDLYYETRDDLSVFTLRLPRHSAWE